MASKIRRGAVGKFEQTHSPQYSALGDTERLARSYKADDFITLKAYYDSILAGRSPDGFSGYVITELNLTHAVGGSGVLVIVGDKPKGPEALPDPTIDLQWTVDSRDLRRHPRYENLTRADHKAIKDALDAEGDPDFSGASDPALAEELYKFLVGGTESYRIAVPVVTWTSYSTRMPVAGGINTISRPPRVPPGCQKFVWLKTGDNVSEEAERRFKRVEEWTGADSIPDEIYERW